MFPDGSASTESAWDAGDLCLIPGSGGSPGEGNGNPFQISCLENPLDGGAWRATVHGVTKSLTRLSDSSNVHVRSPALGDCPSPLPITSAPPITCVRSPALGDCPTPPPITSAPLITCVRSPALGDCPSPQPITPTHHQRPTDHSSKPPQKPGCTGRLHVNVSPIKLGGGNLSPHPSWRRLTPGNLSSRSELCLLSNDAQPLRREGVPCGYKQARCATGRLPEGPEELPSKADRSRCPGDPGDVQEGAPRSFLFLFLFVTKLTPRRTPSQTRRDFCHFL